MQIHIDTLNLHIHTGHTALGAELVKAALKPCECEVCDECTEQEASSSDQGESTERASQLPPALAALLAGAIVSAIEKHEKDN